MCNNCQHVICLRILKHSVATNPRAITRCAVAIVVVASIVARRAVATVIVVGRRRHCVAPSPIVPSSAYVGYLLSTLFFLLTCMFVHCSYTSLCFSMYSFMSRTTWEYVLLTNFYIFRFSSYPAPDLVTAATAAMATAAVSPPHCCR